jgi:betaine-aldehyde dehydrogenase
MTMHSISMPNRMWINGEWVSAASGESFAVINPATEEVLSEVPRGGEADINRAVAAAEQAFKTWGREPGLHKCELLHAVAAKTRAHRLELATLITLEGGKPLLENLDEIEWVAACFDYYAELGRDLKGRVIAPVQHHQFNAVIREPIGVVGCIVPWNYPLLLLAWKLAPALAAGNTVVIKPSELTPLSTLRFIEMLSGLPQGAVNVVTGYGLEAGHPLASHHKVGCIAFTGSVGTGQRILQAAIGNVKRTHMELGGNDPFIVCDDADLDVAVRACAWAAFLNNGQVCTSAERIYVFESIADEFISRLVDFTKTLRLGNPMHDNVDLGPLVSASQRARVMARIDEAVRGGARLLCGGTIPADPQKGFYLTPAVLDHVDHSMSLMREEVFGPVAPVMRVSGIDEAIAMANDSVYGLGASIMTRSMDYAMTAMEGIKAGTFWINDPLTDNEAGPFGGMRMSGGGRELGWEGLEAFTDVKHMHMDYRMETKSYWFPYGAAGGSHGE